MSYGICTIGYMCGRAEARDASEQVTQLVFGEHYTILEEQEKWCKITTALDQYTCWIDKKQLSEISWQTFEELTQNTFEVVSEANVQATDQHGTSFTLPIGAILPFLHKQTCKLGQNSFSISDTLHAPIPWTDLLAVFGKSTYLWGGRTQFGIDCSGFSQMAYRTHGINLLRDAYQQEEDERASLINFDNNQEGDLAFFINESGKTTHVGIVLSNNQIIHASGFLRIDTLTKTGIVSSNNQQTHTLKNIKRYENS
jgi:hypothetical protein